MCVCGCNIPERAVSVRAPLTALTSTCQPAEPPADSDNVPEGLQHYIVSVDTAEEGREEEEEEEEEATLDPGRTNRAEPCRTAPPPRPRDPVPAPDTHTPRGARLSSRTPRPGVTAPAGRVGNERGPAHLYSPPDFGLWAGAVSPPPLPHSHSCNSPQCRIPRWAGGRVWTGLTEPPTKEETHKAVNYVRQVETVRVSVLVFTRRVAARTCSDASSARASTHCRSLRRQRSENSSGVPSCTWSITH
ncbi:hypothetical protein JOB18_029976 [Solea senegalensis]|uniref:Uncharacterized protein n=1 Tax=Solea senegalensis TaxID=28829 RepID=A0AAV6QHC4_SOLSE|nr:hypothetical protein JOB18_029976 [Solea senegalensis]